MRRIGYLSSAALAVLVATSTFAAPKPTYVRKTTRVESLLASLKAGGLPTLEGKWYYLGPFDNEGGAGFDAVYPPEKEIDLKKSYPTLDGDVGWKEFKDFRVGSINDLKFFKHNDDACVYVYQEIEAADAVELPISIGSDDGIKLWLNGKKLIEDNVIRAAAPDQDHTTLKLKAGKNQLLIKIVQAAGEWAFYIRPELPLAWPKEIREQLDKDFPIASIGGGAPASDLKAEAVHYKIVTVPAPEEAVLEALGLVVDGKDVYIAQRPELTKLVDTDGDDVADEYTTVCDKWGVSGDYHEFAFGPARDKEGNFFVTLNVGFGGGHQSKAPWRGWCVKITPKGELIPWATGLRSPNGINFSPDGDLFYVDNQGEWVATCKMHHVKKGEYYGHPAGLRWVKDSPFVRTIPEQHLSGMFYDGQKGEKGVEGMPPLTPPCIWFPYGRMGQSASEPRWDTTGGKFGPFAGQCFVGDQTKSMIMRVALEKVNGKYQGACFPFRSGFQCGINRLVFGPDGSLYAGQTARGWGSLGPKPYGLQRLVFTGVEPFEIHSMHLTKDGFDLTFTKPLDPATAEKLASYSMQSFTHYYWGTYGSPEVDRKAEKITGVSVSADRKTVSLAVSGFKPGRVYEVHLDGLKSTEGQPVLHPEGFYTLNELP
jgi:hypothetical protein